MRQLKYRDVTKTSAQASDTKMPTCFFSSWPEYFPPPSYIYDFISTVYSHGVNPWIKLNFLFLPTVVTSRGQQCFGWRKSSRSPLVDILEGGGGESVNLPVRTPLFLFLYIPFLRSSSVSENPEMIIQVNSL